MTLQMISDVEGMMLERLRHYQAKNKGLPNRVIIFRDGVSEVYYHYLKLYVERSKIIIVGSI